MKRTVLAVAATLALTACSGHADGPDRLSTTEACAEAREPVEDAMTGGDVAGAAAVLRDVAERGNDQVQRIFGDAADAADYIAENGNMEGAPQWATMSFEELDATCGTTRQD
ncbi:hypothetical protein [Nocardioides sp.]|uniref:hypothetical protein n=1 Tax=Nocardioides sp. TaxID=35761 RepID=UPI002CA45B0A|nr:hypothetical protein [Nocardioides sp.]HXH77164.1 hypothetical protein [Nocardioides sp.]